MWDKDSRSVVGAFATEAEALAAVRGVGVSEIAALTTANFHRLFAKAAQ